MLKLPSDFVISAEIPSSKSVYNRALIVQSYFSGLELRGFSNCDDVSFMKSALASFKSSATTKALAPRSLDVGEGGTTFRFLALRVSREIGEFSLNAKPRLLERPQEGLLDLLAKLGIQVEVSKNHWLLKSQGWDLSKTLEVQTSESSQYASALLLNAWNLPQDLNFNLIGDKVSEAYFRLSLDLVRDLGMEVLECQNSFRIPAGQKVLKDSFRVESDLSSAFTVAAIGALTGGARLKKFPFSSKQPDKVFLEIFKKMNIPWHEDQGDLVISPASEMKNIEVDLFDAPDLFPVLSILCAFAEGKSRLHNAPQLVAKESNRILKTAELLKLANISCEPTADGMTIHGHATQTPRSFEFDPDHDHRMVMAAEALIQKGFPIQVQKPETINKSFPEFWNIVRGSL